ncbi:MAG: RNA 2',3'-cyclic phosphodiesterase [Candidatus Omnitrophica bacterium]|nr:RNA 2',3'-cyclic phosphodiesterase [Candidatus Omnitrophota bacterium]
MRAFIAIELSEEIRDSLAQAQAHLKYAGADVKWVEKNNIHLTLKFLGEIDEERGEKVKSILDQIAKDTKPFEITIKDIGAFPKLEFPRVIWAGLDKGADESKTLAKKIDEALSKIGFQKESRPFAAHLTIGRVRTPKNRQALKEKVESFNSQLLTQNSQLITSVILFQSTLTPKGPIYTKLHEAGFSK